MANIGPSIMREMLINDFSGFKFRWFESHLERDLFLVKTAKNPQTSHELNIVA